ncbi:hypothetical protein NOR53_2727 [gamma proteobacterium NOR5-3]|nr:hypothetical protein NOR53_2727 [gamma proteobacterium NOR5-3]
MSPIFHHRIDNDELLAHAGDESDFLGLSEMDPINWTAR